MATVPLTLVHLAAELDDETLARCCHEAVVKYRTTPRQIEALLKSRPNSPGAGKLRLIASGDTKRVDCRWRGKRLTVELNGFRFHNSRYKDVFEDSRRMRAELTKLLT